MKTIEERAKAYRKKTEREVFKSGMDISTMEFEYAYKQGATEQKAIDDAERDTAVYNLLLLKLDDEKKLWTDKACEWIKSNLDPDEGGEIELCFRKAMEEQQ